MKKIITWILLSVNILLVIITAMSYCGAYLAPSFSTLFAFSVLLLPVWIVIHLMFIVIWLIIEKQKALISLVTLFLGFYPITRFITISFFSSDLQENNSLKIMSYNVRVFDLYNWDEEGVNKNKIISFLDKEQPDIICFQEYYHGEDTHFSVRDTLENYLGYRYHHEHFVTTSTHKYHPGLNYFGSAIFSKYPILEKETIIFDNDKGNHVTIARIVKNKDTIAIYNGHLGSLKLQANDYKLIGGSGSPRFPWQKKEESNFIARFQIGYLKREAQLEVLKKYLEKEHHPIVLCVDLNDVPNSYAYRQLNKTLSDAFIQSGSGIGSTYIGNNMFNKILPVNRIDYIFYSPSLKSSTFITHDVNYSDHRPISARIGWE